MTTMDVKGLSWVGHMCQRFEALCVDVDEAIYEDTFIYVGNQMRTVGESVKKFYSEVMQDLLSSSSLDSAKGKDALNTVEHNYDATIWKKQKLDNESESVDTASKKTGNPSDGVATVKKSVSHGPCPFTEEQSTPENYQSQFADLVSTKSSTVKTNIGQEQEALLKSVFDVSHKGSFEEFARSKSWNERDESLCGCGDISSIEASAVKVCESNENKVEISGDITERYANALAVKGTQTKGTSTELDKSSMKAVLGTSIDDNKRDAVEVDDVQSVSDTETSRCCLAHETRTAAADKQERLKLEDSCVLVENDDHFSKLTLENVQKSYKKKIRAVFSPRKWAKTKRDQDQLAGKHDEQCGKSSLSTCTRLTEIQNSPTSESFDSEWELL